MCKTAAAGGRKDQQIVKKMGGSQPTAAVSFQLLPPKGSREKKAPK